MSVISLEEKKLYWSHPYQIQDEKIIITQMKEQLELTIGKNKVIDHRNRIYPIVLDKEKLLELNIIK